MAQTDQNCLFGPILVENPNLITFQLGDVIISIKMNWYNTKTNTKKYSNKLRMKALVGWNTLFQVQELINIIFFFTRIKNDIDKVDKIAWDLN